MTLAAVCKRAGISKGGLMHHYATKEALVEAFIKRSADSCIDSVHQQLKPLSKGKGKRVRAYVNLMLKDPAMCDASSSRDDASVMIALMQGQGQTAAEAYYSRIAKELKGDGVSAALVELIVTTVDGLWMQSTVLPHEIVSKRANRIRLQLIRMIDMDLEPGDTPRRPKLAAKRNLLAGDAS